MILAAGDFPKRGGRAWEILARAKRVVCCDSAALAYHRRFRRWPDVIVGDLDSLGARRVPCRVIHDANQDTNDLTKAIGYCRGRGWRDLTVVGATGRREDHAIGNVFRALAAGVRLVTETGTFHPVRGRAAFRVRKGTPVSVFAPDPETRMDSTGLEWPLRGVKFANLYCATLNRTTASRFAVTSDRPVFVFIAEI